jgi:uncharacterized metal-binding protein YceD (DUF177 family)
VITKEGKVAFKVLEKQELELTCDEKDRWVQGVLKDAAPPADISGMSAEEWAAKSTFSATLRGSKMVAQSEYELSGDFQATVPGLCGRCGKELISQRNGHFQIYFQLMEKGKDEDDSGDPDLIMTTAGEIDLRATLAEQLIIQEPMVEQHPEGECEAIVHIESDGPLDGAQDAVVASGPFAGLKGLKIES